MTAVNVRAATVGDCPALADLIGGLLAQHDTRAPADFAAVLARDEFGATARFEALIAEHDGGAVGAALYYPVYRPSLAGHGLLMEDLYVRPAARRLGVGRRIMARLAGLARARACRYIEWVTAAGNVAGQSFYGALGAVPIADRTGYQIDGDALARLAGEV